MLSILGLSRDPGVFEVARLELAGTETLSTGTLVVSIRFEILSVGLVLASPFPVRPLLGSVSCSSFDSGFGSLNAGKDVALVSLFWEIVEISL